nr:hypothetical protein [uncultured Pseudogulbenkiania sp.]
MQYVDIERIILFSSSGAGVFLLITNKHRNCFFLNRCDEKSVKYSGNQVEGGFDIPAPRGVTTGCPQAVRVGGDTIQGPIAMGRQQENSA